MCGIAGWIDYKKDLTKEVKTLGIMSQKLKFRGPDEAGEEVTDNAALLHRRLIILDKEMGKQPMTKTKDGKKFTLIYNGQLYNTQELYAELKSLGHTFKGYSDTEILLNAYMQWGKECVQRLNGIFAFAVWEHNAKKLFLARDRFGIKPLYFYIYNSAEHTKGIIFGSEIKVLLANPLVPHTIDNNGLRQLFLLGPGKISGSGIIKNIMELKPAHYLIMEQDGINTSQYWYLEAKQHTDNLFMTIEKTRWLVLDSIKRQLRSDVPLACFLSGGLDSSLISAVVASVFAERGETLTTYSVDYKDNDKYFERNFYQPDSDFKYISQMSEFIKSKHINIVLDNEEVGAALTEATNARDLPGMADIDSSLMLFCRKIKENSTVCLSGECADEIFGGYPWYHNEEILNSHTFPWARSLDIRKKLIKDTRITDDMESWIDIWYQDTLKRTSSLSVDTPFDKRMREMFMLNNEWFMQTLLDRNDRITMYCGVEVRVPYCDYRIVEYAYNMPWKYKAYNGREKGILREAVKDLLPYDIVKRKKSPYPKTFSPIYINFVKQKVSEIINQKDNILNEILNKEYLEELILMKDDFNDTFYGQLMRLPQLLGYIIQTDAFFKDNKIEIVN